jgi:hypothetical protein
MKTRCLAVSISQLAFKNREFREYIHKRLSASPTLRSGSILSHFLKKGSIVSDCFNGVIGIQLLTCNVAREPSHAHKESQAENYSLSRGHQIIHPSLYLVWLSCLLMKYIHDDIQIHSSSYRPAFGPLSRTVELHIRVEFTKPDYFQN